MAALPPVDHSLDGESRFSEIVGILAFCSVLSTTAVALRVYTRWHLIDAFGADDGTMVVAQVSMDLSALVSLPMLTSHGNSSSP